MRSSFPCCLLWQLVEISRVFSSMFNDVPVVNHSENHMLFREWKYIFSLSLCLCSILRLHECHFAAILLEKQSKRCPDLSKISALFPVNCDHSKVKSLNETKYKRISDVPSILVLTLCFNTHLPNTK